MSSYIKFVCDYCGRNEIEISAEFERADSIESTRYLLWDYGWNPLDGDMCESCMRDRA